MGSKEQEKKGKRAFAATNPEAKRLTLEVETPFFSIVAKMPPGTAMNVYKCLFPKTNRLMICRNMDCSELGSFYGYNTDWISNCGAGGWKFACPHCAHPYNKNLEKVGSCQRTTFGTSRQTRA